MENQGWISLHRKILDSAIWNTNEKYTKRDAWIYLLLRANHADGEITSGNERIIINRGQFMTSELKLCTEFKWGRTKLRNFLGVLTNVNKVRLKRTSKHTTVTIVNYDSYQKPQTSNEQPKNNQKTTSKQPKNINNNNNNKNNVNKREEKEINKEKSIEKLHEIQIEINNRFEAVSKMKTQLTYANCETLINEYGYEYELIIETLEALENNDAKNKHGKPYKSVFLTLKNWCKNANSRKNYQTGKFDSDKKTSGADSAKRAIENFQNNPDLRFTN